MAVVLCDSGVSSHSSDGGPGQESEARWGASSHSLLDNVPKEIMAKIASMESASFVFSSPESAMLH